MNRRRNLVSLDPDQAAETSEHDGHSSAQSVAENDAETSAETNDSPTEEAEVEVEANEWGAWAEEDDRPARSFGWAVPALALISLAAWSGFFGWVHQAQMIAGGTPQLWQEWITSWSIPVLLIVMVWGLTVRNSTREARRFGETAMMLSEESAALETRLVSVNRELSMARDFIASQSRDLESLGRVATERLSQNADQLQSLIHDNGEQVNAIGSVSDNALTNMDKLRDQLPVIANSARDVASQIGNAGITAQSQVDEMISAFARLNDFGEASERQVSGLRANVDETLGLFENRTQELDRLTQERFSALRAQNEEFRVELETRETDSLAAIRRRATELSSELAAANEESRQREDSVISEIRDRLVQLREEGTNLVEQMRQEHGQSEAAWQGSIEQFRTGLSQAIEEVGRIDAASIENARGRLDALSQAASRVDSQIQESADAFETEFARRRDQNSQREAEVVAGMEQRIADFDLTAKERQEEHLSHMAGLAERGDALARRLGDLDRELSRLADHGREESGKLTQSTEALADRLSQNRSLLEESRGFLANLTDDSVRLLEIIRSSADHSGGALSDSIGVAEGRLSRFQRLVGQLHDSVAEAEAKSGVLVENLGKSNAESSTSLTSLEEMENRLTAIASQSRDLSEQARRELQESISSLASSSEETLDKMRKDQAALVDEIAAGIGSEASGALGRAIRDHATETISDLEQASLLASERGRDVAAQLRDQLAMVNELAGNLEQRVAQARSEAEEQVDNDFTRRMALITDSLNSISIDIDKAFESEVTDTAWASYLRGDRGIFTRRAVRLLDQQEARSLSETYQLDEEFRHAVNRYIHDFEAMLRSVLSTRDGNAIGVTLLSSDIGKLYVALAQAIERLRD